MEQEKLLSQLVEKLTKTFGDRLVSVILYGSAASQEVHQNFSDLNVFCVLSQLEPVELQDSEPVFRWWREHKNPAPLLMSGEEVRTSTDCFPIEFKDMLECRKVLYGQDVIAGLVIDESFYRAQVEYQLRSKLLRLRQKAAGVLFDKELLVRLMVDSVSTFLILGRHALLLQGADAPPNKRAVLAELGSRLGLHAGPFLTLLEIREGTRKPKEIDAMVVFAQYLKGVEALVAAVDRLEK